MELLYLLTIIVFVKLLGFVFIKFFTIKRGDPNYDWGTSQIPRMKNLPKPPRRGKLNNKSIK